MLCANASGCFMTEHRLRKIATLDDRNDQVSEFNRLRQDSLLEVGPSQRLKPSLFGSAIRLLMEVP